MADRALIFAGQGAQFVGMGRDLAEAYPECRAVFEEADAVLGYPISRICFEGPMEELTRTNHCQPAIFLTSVACYRALELKRPDLVFKGAAGLSLGEWSALHVAGALTFEDTLRVLEARGRFMQDACDEREGGMVSVIGLPDGALAGICESAGVEVSNLNSAQQVVLSGPREGVEKAEKMAQEAGAKRTVVLTVAGAYHSSLMSSAAGRLEEVLAGIDVATPAIPVIANVTGRPHGSPDEIRRDMVLQVTSAVRWLSCVEWFRSNGATEYVECGPGKVLSGLIRRIDRDAGLHNVQDCKTLDATVAGL